MKKSTIKNLNDIRKQLKTKFFEIDSNITLSFKWKKDKQEEIQTSYDLWLKRYTLYRQDWKIKFCPTLKDLRKDVISDAKKLWLKDSNDFEWNISSNDLNLDFNVDLEKNNSNFNLNSVADLKRLPIGTFLRRKYTPKVDKLWTFVKIRDIQSNALNLLYDETNNVTSRLDLPKASDCKISWNQIIYYIPWTRKIDLVYDVFEDEWLSLEQMKDKYKNDAIIWNFSLEDIEWIQRTDNLAIVFLKKSNRTAFFDTNEDFSLIWISDNDLEKAEISQYFPWYENDSRFTNSRARTEIYYATSKSPTNFNIVITRDMYKTFKELEIIWNEEIWQNLIKADWKYYEIEEDRTNIPSWRNYWFNKLIEYTWKIIEKDWKTPEKIAEEIKEKNIKKDIEEKVWEVYNSNYRWFNYISEKNAIKYLKHNWLVEAPKDFEKNMDERENYFTTNAKKEWLFIVARVRKEDIEDYRAKQYISISIKKLKHIDINEEDIKTISEKYNKMVEELESLEHAWKNEDPLVKLNNLLEKELEGYTKREANVTFKDWRIEKRRLFKGSRWFWYLPKGSSKKGYTLDLEKIETITFN